MVLLQRISFVSIVILSCIIFMLAIGESSPLMYVLIAVYLSLSALTVFLNKSSKVIVDIKGLFFILAFFVFSLVCASVWGGLGRVLGYFLFLISFLVFSRILTLEAYVWRLSIFLACFSPLLLIMSSKGLVLENYPAAFILPFSIVIFSKFGAVTKISIFVLIALVSVSYLTGARTIILAGVFSWLALALYYWSPRLTRFFIISLLVLSILITFSLVYSDWMYEMFTESLTYRPTLWRFYVSSMESLWVGGGFEIAKFGVLAADDMSYELGRGVAEKYGLHSFYVSILFQLGIVGFILTFAYMAYAVLFASARWLGFVAAAIVVAMFTSIALGNPSIYGIFLIILAAAVVETKGTVLHER